MNCLGRSYWIICLPREVQQPASEIANLQFDTDSGEIQFQWVSMEPKSRAALRNAYLQLSASESEATIAFRPASAAPKLKLTFQKPQEIVRPSIEDCPESDDFILRVPSVEGLSQGAQFRGKINEGTVGKEIVIEFDQMPGTIVELELVQPREPRLGFVRSIGFQRDQRQSTLPSTELKRSKKTRVLPASGATQDSCPGKRA